MKDFPGQSNLVKNVAGLYPKYMVPKDLAFKLTSFKRQ